MESPKTLSLLKYRIQKRLDFFEHLPDRIWDNYTQKQEDTIANFMDIGYSVVNHYDNCTCKKCTYINNNYFQLMADLKYTPDIKGY